MPKLKAKPTDNVLKRELRDLTEAHQALIAYCEAWKRFADSNRLYVCPKCIEVNALDIAIALQGGTKVCVTCANGLPSSMIKRSLLGADGRPM